MSKKIFPIICVLLFLLGIYYRQIYIIIFSVSMLFLLLRKEKLASKKTIDKEEDIKTKRHQDHSIIEKYPDFSRTCFGRDCPTENQFSYALHLGINVNKKTFKSISTAIDKAKEIKPQKPIAVDIDDEEILYEYLVSQSPANADYMAEIKEFHAVLPREITNAEAEDIIEFLENHHINCPYCNKKLDSIMFSMPSCPFCDKSFRSLKIPIFLP